MNFRTTVLQAGKTATGLQVPDELVSALGSGKRPKVVITVAGYRYRTTVAPMGGRYLVPLSAEHRTAAGVAAGDEVEVDIELDQAPRGRGTRGPGGRTQPGRPGQRVLRR